MRILLVFARAYPGESLLMLACLLVAGLFQGVGLSTIIPALGVVTGESGGIVGSRLAAISIDAIASVGLEPSLGVLLSVVVAALWISGGLFLLANLVVGTMVAQVATGLRLDLLRALAGTRWSYYVHLPVGRVTNAFATEAERGSMAYYHATVIVSNLIQMGVFAAVAIAVSWSATIVAAVVGLFTLGAVLPLIRVTRRAGAKQTRLLRLLLTRLSDTLQAVKPLKAMARERLVGPLLERDTERLNRVMQREVLANASVRALYEPITVTFIAIGVYVAVTSSSVELATLLLLAVLFGRSLTALNRATRQYQRMSQHQSAFWSMRELIEGAEAQHEEGWGTKEPTLERGIAFRSVSFSHEGQPVLQGCSLEIPAGHITALLGPSGAGKTTISDLIVGLLRPDAGEIEVDGVPLAEIDIRRWRGLIGYVPQEIFLLHDSVATNVSLGDPAISRDEIEDALRRAGAWDYVSRLQDGIDTLVGERGSKLSGGQRQRIAIARALVHRPSLLILDEPTTALDPATERAVWSSLSALRGETTMLAISHQPTLAGVADRIYRVEGGRVRRVEDGAAAAL